MKFWTMRIIEINKHNLNEIYDTGLSNVKIFTLRSSVDTWYLVDRREGENGQDGPYEPHRLSDSFFDDYNFSPGEAELGWTWMWPKAKLEPAIAASDKGTEELDVKGLYDLLIYRDQQRAVTVKALNVLPDTEMSFEQCVAKDAVAQMAIDQTLLWRLYQALNKS